MNFMKNQKVISEEYGENGTVMELMVDAQMYDKIREYICKMSKKDVYKTVKKQSQSLLIEKKSKIYCKCKTC
mgnify:CR=1 FL=1